MVIEIMAKPKIKEFPWLKIVLYLPSTLFLAFSLSYFLLIGYQLKLKRELAELERKLVKTPAEEVLEQDVLASERQINNWKIIASHYPLTLRAFEFLEKNTHPQVWFSDFKLDVEKGTIDLSAQAKSFESLAQQFFILKKQEFIKRVTISNVSIGKKGEIMSKFQINLDPQILSSQR